jgi:hypothetical protein
MKAIQPILKLHRIIINRALHHQVALVGAFLQQASSNRSHCPKGELFPIYPMIKHLFFFKTQGESLDAWVAKNFDNFLKVVKVGWMKAIQVILKLHRLIIN